MFSYTPNSYQPFPRTPPLQQSPNYKYLCRSSFCPRALQGQVDLTQSVCVHPTTSGSAVHPEADLERARLSESVQVVPESSGGFRVLRPGASISSLQRQPVLDATALDGHRRLSRNIGSTHMQQQMQDRLVSARLRLDSSQSYDSRGALTRSLTLSRSNSSAFGSSLLSLSSAKEPLSTLHESYRTPAQQSPREELQCSCKVYHSHVFDGRPLNRELEQETRKFMDSLASNMEEAKEDSHDDMRNIFWTPSLSFHPYHHGDKRVEFPDLWPTVAELHEHFENSGIQRTVLRDSAILDLCKLAVTCGPVRLLHCLFDLELVRVDQQMDNGTGMLHLALLSHNVEAIHYLTGSAKISPKLRDKTGKTADQVCYSSSIKRHLPPRYQMHKESRQTAAESRMVLKASVQDKDTIFKLAANPKHFDEIQKKLQTLDFNINTECDTNGDFLLHIACRRGLMQLPLIMALVKIQGADVELCNAEGVTPLMLAASAGNQVLCDVLMCLFGADPNKPNPNSGRCALHYAVEGNHRKTVECLIRRGADVNSEDHMGRRPDDVPICKGTNEDCHEVIQFNRKQRMENLCEHIRKGELERHHILHTDLYLVDDESYTLVMTAAIYNRPYALEVLLLANDTTIDAQHVKTGMTALSIAAQMGNVEAVEILLSRGANPAIADMKNYLPLHYAVLNNQEKVVDSMLDYFPQCYCGIYTASRLCKRTSIHIKLKSAFIRRQEEIVTPKLLACAMRGAADELFQLLDEGDNINPKSGTGNWPLYLAVENGNLDVVMLLCQRGGDIRRRHASTGETVLHIGAKMGHLEITRYLLGFCRPSSASKSSHRRKLLDINNPDANNRTPFQLAAEKGFSKIVELLVQHGATTALLDAGGQLISCTQFEGIRMQIETLRQQHTKDIVALITDRSKKAFEQLQKIWLPRFDHNLRTRQGDTPLMTACAAGKLQIVKFLLESAVYSVVREDDDSDDDSDADSGVLAPSGGKRHPQAVKHSDGEELQASGVFSQSTELQAAQYVNSGDFTQSMECLREESEASVKTERSHRLLSSMGTPHRSLEVLLHDVNRPKGLYIFHDGLVSHVCAVSLRDGSTALHRAVEQGDSFQLVKVLLGADRSCVSIQNDDGLTPLHLACKLGRKKIIEMLLATEGLDLNARTLDCLLPEETTNNKSIIRMVQKARLQQTGIACPPPKMVEADLRDDASSTNSPSQAGSIVNFDKVHSRYEALRKEVKNVALE